MSLARTVKTSFASGEIGDAMLGRVDLRAYENGARALRNVFVQPTGGVRRRPGLAYVGALPGKTRLVPFEFNIEQAYLLAFGDSTMRVYKDGALQATIATPWTAAQLAQIAWTQSADTLLVVHPDVPPRKITRQSHASWTVEAWSYFEDKGAIHQPFHKFAGDAVTLQPSATSGTVTLTASAPVFDAAHVGTRIRIAQKQAIVTGVASATSATATVPSGQGFADTAANKDWEEQAFSALRGWPTSVTFHQDRLVIGGSRDLPNRLWLSKSGDLFNFDLGSALDDEAIEFALLSDQVNAIRAVFSGRHLQVLTSGAEWMVTGDPLTPENVQLNRQTRIGAPVDRYIRPRDVDGATLFVGRGGKDLREFLFAEAEQAYQSTDLALLASHLVRAPVDLDYDPDDRLVHLVNADGTLATVTVYRAEQVTAWSLQTTEGAFRSIAVVSGECYFAIERDGAWSVERFDKASATDACIRAASIAGDPPRLEGLGHLNGRTVDVVIDGLPLGQRAVAGGGVGLPDEADLAEAGLPFVATIEPLPPGGPAGTPRSVRLIEASFRLLDTAQMRVDTGSGFVDVPFRGFGGANAFDSAPQFFTGEKRFRALGWKRAGVEPLWRVELPAPLPFQLLSVTQEMKVND
jgi:hypothetical protein